MKVLVLDAILPASNPAADALYQALLAALGCTRGVEAEGFRIPVGQHGGVPGIDAVVDDLMVPRSLRIDHVDRLLVLDPTLSLAEHHNKVLWLSSGILPPDAPRLPQADIAIRAAVHAAERLAVEEARHAFATNAAGAQHFESVTGRMLPVLRPPHLRASETVSLRDARTSSLLQAHAATDAAPESAGWPLTIEELLR